MAESGRLGNFIFKTKESNSPEESMCLFNTFCVFLSLVTILADVATVSLVLVEYCKNGLINWALTTAIFVVFPNLLVNIFSLRWILSDRKARKKHWLTHFLLIGLIERYFVFLQKVFSCKDWEILKTENNILSQKNDLTLLHFLYTFTGTVPQIILQLYAMIVLDVNHDTKVFFICVSTTSVIWSCSAYIYSISSFNDTLYPWLTISLKLTWHLSMLVARICAILLFTINFEIWTLLPLGLHWAGMTFWIITQKTSFCSNKLEETFYNIVMGFIYCFCYINLRDGKTRYRLMMFYSLILSQNFGSLFAYIITCGIEQQRKIWSIVAAVLLILGTATGVSSMVLYYRRYHEKGPLKWRNDDIEMELNNKTNTTQNKKTNLTPVRSFKSSKIANIIIPNRDSHVSNTNKTVSTSIGKQVFEGNAKFQNSLISNESMDISRIEIFTVENTSQTDTNEKNYELKSNVDQNPSLCSPNMVVGKMHSVNALDLATNTVNKRRGICSSDELKDDLDTLTVENLNKINLNDQCLDIGHASNKKSTISDSLDLDLDLSLSDINSSDINTFNENIVQKLCFSALKNIKDGNQNADIENIQKIALDILKKMHDKTEKKGLSSNQSGLIKSRELDTPTEVMSVHDYENICAVNIAREAWGLRSWNGYYDIENWLHDGSVVRDRRRDTLTSASSEISSCLSQDLKNSILSAIPFSKKVPTYSNVFVKFDKCPDSDYVNTEVRLINSEEMYLARPCIVDNKEHLAPILEEFDDLCDKEKTKQNCESSLVATIDEIRKVTITNSPRNLYHRRQSWDSPQFNPTVKIEPNLKRALWKEPSRFDYNNIKELIPEKGNDSAHGQKPSIRKKEKNIDERRTENEIAYFTTPHAKRNNVENHLKNSSAEERKSDLSNNDIDLLWKLVSERSLSLSSTENSAHMTSSLQSLIPKENAGLKSKTVNIRKSSKTKPRRKFSILREKFEPRAIRNFHDQTVRPQTNFDMLINVRNKLDVGVDSKICSISNRSNCK